MWLAVTKDPRSTYAYHLKHVTMCLWCSMSFVISAEFFTKHLHTSQLISTQCTWVPFNFIKKCVPTNSQMPKMVLSTADPQVMGSCPGVFCDSLVLTVLGPHAQILALLHPTASHGINQHTSLLVSSPHLQIQVKFSQGEECETQVTNCVIKSPPLKVLKICNCGPYPINGTMSYQRDNE